MKLNALRNNKGSALLWCVLMTIIVTILLGSILTATYAYFNYTMRTVKRQQAYFTARSAMNSIMEEFASEEQERDTSAGSIAGSYKESQIPIMPANKNEIIKINNFNFEEGMGTATAEISLYVDKAKNKVDEEKVSVTVTSQYADETYEMNATIARQPLYFGGIAIKTLILNGSNFELAEGTDLYFYTYRNDTLKGSNKAATFDTTCVTAADKTAQPVQLLNGSTVTINGNLVTQGDAKISPNCRIAGFKFSKNTDFTSTKLTRKIWNSNQYIISNKTLEVSETNGKYSTNLINTFRNLSHTTLEYCNNTRLAFENGRNIQVPTVTTVGRLIKIPVITMETRHIDATFGAPANLFGSAMESLVSTIDEFIPNNMTKFGTILSDNNVDDLAITKTTNDALTTQYIELLSLSNSMSNIVDTIGNKTVSDIFDAMFGDVIQNYGLTVKDISYINFSDSGSQSVGDNVTPLTYLMVEDNLYVRIKYGQKPDMETPLNQIRDRISNSIDDIVNSWTGITKKCSCVIVYLGKNATLELGTGTPHIQGTDPVYKGDKPFTAANQTYFYTIYGLEGSTVKLKGNGNGGGKVPMTFVGSIECDNLEAEGDVSVIYTSTNGAQVAKQKVAEYWTVINYSD